MRGKDFDGDVTPKTGVPGFVDLTHSAFAKGSHDLVRAEAGA